jgi:hypothetical protein
MEKRYEREECVFGGSETGFRVFGSGRPGNGKGQDAADARDYREGRDSRRGEVSLLIERMKDS